MLRVYPWIGIPDEVIKLISNLMELWKTRMEIWTKWEKMTSRWINISCEFLQGDSFLPVGFFISEIPVCQLLQRAGGTEWAHQEAEMSLEYIAYLLMIWWCIKKVMGYSEMTMKLLYRKATIQGHNMEYQNVQRLCLNEVRWSGRKIRSSGRKNENDGLRRKWNL